MLNAEIPLSKEGRTSIRSRLWHAATQSLMNTMTTWYLTASTTINLNKSQWADKRKGRFSLTSWSKNIAWEVLPHHAFPLKQMVSCCSGSTSVERNFGSVFLWACKIETSPLRLPVLGKHIRLWVSSPGGSSSPCDECGQHEYLYSN